ncbi:MAG TPA: transposase [Kofleriaceae bacterium]|nr:transposase [Kofleriaceae bacterium]
MLAGGIYERTSGAAGQPLRGGYRRREPEQTVLHELVSRHAQTMLAELRDADGHGLPGYVERELAEYLRCGILAHGFARVRCTTCHDEIVVAFSCKRRGLCPSCTARRMADTAAHLVDHVLPRAPYRQWVFTVPKALRFRLARDPAWTTWVGNLAVRAIGAWQRRVARQRGLRAPRTGAITFVQRFGGLVNLNVHFHLLIPDGVFTDVGDGLAFALLPAPTGVDLLAILDRVIRQIARRLAEEAGVNNTDDADLPPDLFAQVQVEAATTWRSPATATAHPVRGSDRLRAWCAGFSLHAGVVIADHDRESLERLCRYGARPAFAHDRLAWTADGRISYQLKRPWPDGRTHLVLEPVAFLRRLVGIIPPPRRHLVRYAGIFGPASKARAMVPATDDTAHAACPGTPHPVPPRAHRLPWAELLRRVFAQDVLACPCGGRCSVVAFVADAGHAHRLLVTLGLPAAPATFAPARAPPQTELAWDDPA